MKEYIQKYRLFLIFLGSFFLSYIILTSFYQFYLGTFIATATVDTITEMVGLQVFFVLKGLGYLVEMFPVHGELYLKLNNSIIRIVEGCNAVSVAILFISFVIAFSGKLKTTVLFLLMGLLLIHVLNVLRIAFLLVLLDSFPQYSTFLHDILFPLIIYGCVFILWFIWITQFSRYADK